MEWISVEDFLPVTAEGAGVLAYTKSGFMFTARYILDLNFWEKPIGHQDDDITHWTHLPEPPKDVSVPPKTARQDEQDN